MVKAEPGKLVYDMNALLKDRPADNAYDTLKEIPGVTEKDDQLHPHGNTFDYKENNNLHTLATGEQYQLNTEETHRQTHNYDHNYRLGFNYNFAENNTLSLAYTGGYKERKHETVDTSRFK